MVLSGFVEAADASADFYLTRCKQNNKTGSTKHKHTDCEKGYKEKSNKQYTILKKIKP